MRSGREGEERKDRDSDTANDRESGGVTKIRSS